MTSFAIGAATVTRIEETYEPNFDATKFFPDWRPETVQQHMDWMLPDHYDASSGFFRVRSDERAVARTGTGGWEEAGVRRRP